MNLLQGRGFYHVSCWNDCPLPPPLLFIPGGHRRVWSGVGVGPVQSREIASRPAVHQQGPRLSVGVTRLPHNRSPIIRRPLPDLRRPATHNVLSASVPRGVPGSRQRPLGPYGRCSGGRFPVLSPPSEPSIPAAPPSVPGSLRCPRGPYGRRSGGRHRTPGSSLENGGTPPFSQLFIPTTPDGRKISSSKTGSLFLLMRRLYGSHIVCPL
jgi:hypothetical protein